MLQHDVCIVGLKCYDLLSDNPVPRYLGGIERILVAFAKSLAVKGLKVAFVTYDHGQEEIVEYHGITVIKSFLPGKGLPIVRFIYPRMTAVWGAMRIANARQYLQMGAGSETFVTALGVRLFRRNRSNFIFCAASNMDCEKQLSGISTYHEKLAYKQGLKMADKVICQTGVQAKMMMGNYSIESQAIPMPSEAFGGPEKKLAMHAVSESPRFDLLWVGRTVEVKRIEWYLDLAERCPDAVFHVVGSANQSSVYARNQLNRAANLANVVVHGKVSDEKLEALYERAFALCCTSIKEGFPTTFLEAWKIGLPVITTFDPDNIVRDSGSGRVANSLDQFERALRFLRQDRGAYVSVSDSARTLYADTLSPGVLINRYINLLEI